MNVCVAFHFPRHHKYHTLFNKNNVKVSYSCMDNMQFMINKHNKKVASIDTKPNSQDQCNCRDKDQWPIDKNLLTSGVIYNVRVTTANSKAHNYPNTSGNYAAARKTSILNELSSAEQDRAATSGRDATFARQKN